jgi:hypothetical protein
MEEINVLDAVKAERDAQRQRNLRALMEVLHFGKLTSTEQAEFDRIEKAVKDLLRTSNEKENQLQPLAAENHDEFVCELIDVCDQEAKAFANLTDQLNTLARSIRMRQGKSLGSKMSQLK